MQEIINEPFQYNQQPQAKQRKNITRENISAVDHAERPKRPPSKSLDTYSYQSLVAFKQNVFGMECVYRKAKLAGHIKMTWQDSERWLSGQNALWIAVFNWTYMQTWQMFNSLKESGEKSHFLRDTVEMTCQRKAVLLFAWVIITIQHAFPQDLIAMWRNRPMQAILYLHEHVGVQLFSWDKRKFLILTWYVIHIDISLVILVKLSCILAMAWMLSKLELSDDLKL